MHEHLISLHVKMMEDDPVGCDASSNNVVNRGLVVRDSDKWQDLGVRKGRRWRRSTPKQQLLADKLFLDT